MKVVTAEQMKEIDRKADEAGISTEFLMENAGRAVAEATRDFINYIAGKRILVMVGPGNNGGDALVAARYLHDWGADINIYLLSRRDNDDKNLNLIKQRQIEIASADKDVKYTKLKNMLSEVEVVIDGILGTGRARPIEGTFKEVLGRINQEKIKRPELILIAVDIPTGLNPDTGAVDHSCPSVDLTVTLGLPKVGLYNFPGADRTGKVIIADIGIPQSLSKPIKTELITDIWAKSVLPARPASANKGTFGRILAVVGSENYIGAAYLSCMGAARVGAGIVTLATVKSLQPILASKLTEITYVLLPEAENGTPSEKACNTIQSILPYYKVMLIGCGIGQHSHTREFVKNILFKLPETPPLLVLDADVLNILSEIECWWDRLPAETILTPHPGEMARLTGNTIEEVQANRLDICRRAAMDWHKVVVLKGAFTVIAEPRGRARISTAANASLATAGTGDVLAGAIAGLAGQGMSLFDAASLGVYLHAAAGDMAVSEMGNAGVIASDLLPLLPRVIKKLKG